MNAVLGGAHLYRSASEWKCRVLIVGDDEILRAHLRRLLKRAHFDVQVAVSADEAMHVLQALHFHILLTDVQMPSMDGLELCRKRRTGFPEPHLHILFVNGSSDETVLERMEIARNRARARCAEGRNSRSDRARPPLAR